MGVRGAYRSPAVRAVSVPAQPARRERCSDPVTRLTLCGTHTGECSPVLPVLAETAEPSARR